MLNRNAFFVALFLVDEVVEFGDVRITIKQQTMRGQTVTPGATDFLIITFDALGQIEVNDKTYVGLVDAHAERDGGNNNLRIIADEGFLIFAAIRIFKPSMIWADGIALRCKICGEFIYLFARETIDDARLVFIAFQHIKGLSVWTTFLCNFDIKILAIEAGNEFIRCGELERGPNIISYTRSG